MPQFAAAALHRAPVGAHAGDQIGDVRDALAADNGNQSRSGSVAPVCCLTSSARCDSVYRRSARVSSSMRSSRPVNDTGWNETKRSVAVLDGELQMRPTWSSRWSDDRDDEGDDARAMKMPIARSLTSKRLPTLRCALASSPTPSNCR